MTEGKSPRYLTVKEVAERYGLPVTWVYGCKSLPRRKVGKYLRFREDELEEFELQMKPANRGHNRGYVIRPIREVVLKQRARRRLKMDIL